MAMNWSDEQLEAIKSIGHNELLNAGAGSGKTAVLSEHVIYLLHNGYKLDDLLIMTFTNAAANEMKQRIKQKIEKDDELRDLYSDEIEAAHIQTFDAFYLFIVKKYHYMFGLDKDINIFDGNLIPVLYQRMINNVMDEYYEKQDPLFEHMIIHFCVKNDNLIKEMVQNIINQSHLETNKAKFFDGFVDKFFTDEFIDSLIDMRYQEMRNIIAVLKEKASWLNDEEDRANLEKFFDEFDECINYDELYYKTSHSEFPKKVGAFRTVDNAYRRAIEIEYKESFITEEKSNFGNAETIRKIHMQMEPYARKLIEIAKEVERRMDNYKREHNAFLFSDISNMAMELFDNPVILKEVQDTFKYILVDEYQDTNDIQEAVLQKIGNNNIFMVGDVKQSIYRFRHANCMIFQNKYNDYKHNGKNGHVIDMTNNFRSRRGLISDFNTLFGQLMTKATNLIDYSDGHVTNFGFIPYDNTVTRQTHGYIRYYTYPDNTFEKDEIIEAKAVADDIIDKINNAYPIYDSTRPKQLRRCTFKDFAIIMDRGSKFDVFRRVFAERNIPLFIYADQNVTKNTVFLLAPNLLKVYLGVKNHDYSGEFSHAYLSVARSFLVRDSDKNIYEVIKSNKYDNDPIIKTFKTIIQEHDNEPVYMIFDAIIDKFELYLKIASIGDYNAVCADIDSFKSLLKSLDKLNFSMQECIDYFKDVSHFDAAIKTSPIKESDNSVTMLNVHKSKGLEFPICYYCGLDLPFNRQDSNARSAISKEFGFILPVTGENNETLLARHLFKVYEKQQDFEERLRILYVALTRAKEAAVVILHVPYKKHFRFFLRDCVCYREIFESVKFDRNCKFEIGKSGLGDKFLTYSVDPIDTRTSLFKLQTMPTIEAQAIDKIRASKQADEEVDDSALDFGNKMHAYLERVDMDSKDLSYIENPRERKYVENVINLPIFKGITNETIRHEFPFYDEKNKTLGFIDCLLLKDDEISIIDFKLKNIDDDAYKKQLMVYDNYIRSINKDENKVTHTYLISIIDGTCKKVS